MFPFPSHGDYRRKNMFQDLQDLGLTTNLKVCLDAGNLASYGNQTDKWMDLSGNGYDFFKGSGTGADGGDPTFNGVTGNRSINEYFSSDGGDYFTYDTTNEAWMQTLHKDAAQFSACAWVYWPSSHAADSGIFGTAAANSTDAGVRLFIDNATHNFAFTSSKGSGGGAISLQGPATLTADAWNFVGLAVNENGGVNTSAYITNTTSSLVATAMNYTTPSAANATYTMNVGGVGGGLRPIVSSGRIGSIALWQGTVLTPTNFTDIYSKTKGRYGL